MCGFDKKKAISGESICMWHTSGQISLIFITKQFGFSILNKQVLHNTESETWSCDWWEDQPAVQPGITFLLFCFIRQSHQCDRYRSIALMWRQAGSSCKYHTICLRFSYLQGWERSYKATGNTLRIPTPSLSNRLKTWNLASVYTTYQVSWFFSVQLLNWCIFCGKTMVQGPFSSHL